MTEDGEMGQAGSRRKFRGRAGEVVGGKICSFALSPLPRPRTQGLRAEFKSPGIPPADDVNFILQNHSVYRVTHLVDSNLPLTSK